MAGKGAIVVFLTLEQLRRYGPLPLRLLLDKRLRPVPKGQAQVLRFVRVGTGDEPCEP